MGWTAISDWKGIVEYIKSKGFETEFPLNVLENALSIRGKMVKPETKFRTIQVLTEIGYIEAAGPEKFKLTEEGLKAIQ